MNRICGMRHTVRIWIAAPALAFLILGEIDALAQVGETSNWERIMDWKSHFVKEINVGERSRYKVFVPDGTRFALMRDSQESCSGDWAVGKDGRLYVLEATGETARVDIFKASGEVVGGFELPPDDHRLRFRRICVDDNGDVYLSRNISYSNRRRGFTSGNVERVERYSSGGELLLMYAELFDSVDDLFITANGGLLIVGKGMNENGDLQQKYALYDREVTTVKRGEGVPSLESGIGYAEQLERLKSQREKLEAERPDVPPDKMTWKVGGDNGIYFSQVARIRENGEFRAGMRICRVVFGEKSE